MLRQFMKSAFWDGWDHLLVVIIGNAGFIALTALYYAAATCWPAIRLVVSLVFGALAGAHACALAAMFAPGNETSPREGNVRLYVRSMRKAGTTGMVAGSLCAGTIWLSLSLLPFWLALGALGAVAAAVVILVAVWVVLSLGWVPAVIHTSRATGFQALRKAFAAMAGNPLLSIFLALYNVLGLALSIPLAMLVPGPSGLVMNSCTALRLDMLRYRWLVSVADSQPAGHGSPLWQKSVPWGLLLKEEKDRTAGRRLRDAMFFRSSGGN